MDDIPEVLRDREGSKKRRSQVKAVKKSNAPVRSRSTNSSSLFLVGGLFVAIAIAGTTFAFFANRNSRSNLPTNSPTSTNPTQVKPQTPPKPDKDDKPKSEGNSVPNVLGHLAYQEAPRSELKAITTDGRIRMRNAAATQFLEMQAAASAKGIVLVPISGFRSVNEQEHVFFNLKQQRSQQASERAGVSAPPGYSEHHTGYAIDIGDGKVPATNLNQNFEETAAFRWLQKNAPRYNFEISFPRNNTQGVSYEPWHWRFVGDRDSLETFYKAKTLKK
ncbi:MAG: M15 family metallopeptidase [Xenococcaceae cyanobacterium]